MSTLKLYLDNCCFNRPFDDQSQLLVRLETEAKLFIQSLIKYGDILLVSSFILYSEIIDNPFEYKRNSILRFVDHYAKKYISSEVVPEMMVIADEIMTTGIKPFDAAHVACAILADCDYFITTDDRLLKYKTDRIPLVNPIAFAKIWKEVT